MNQDKTPDRDADTQREQGSQDIVWPERESAHGMTVVGIGASAGGVRALQEFFEQVRPDSGSAFVVVVHLSAEFESHLAEVLSRATTLPVRQVTESVTLAPNQVYVIPPGHQMVIAGGELQLAQPTKGQGQRVVIDQFFRTLADGFGPQAIAVVLSGTGADGTLGIKQIKEMGGLTIAQDPADADHEGMPRSAVTTGMVDYVLPAREIPAQIAQYWSVSRRMRIPEEAAPSPEQAEEGPVQEESLRDILGHVRIQTGHDFGVYKRATVLRRVGRRLQVNAQESLPDYLDYLRRHPAEVNELVSDLLISVTQFFRNPDSWQTLERDVLPRLIRDLKPEETFRAWVCGCATGEEAYSLAILLNEVALRLGRSIKFQIFATDMHASAIGQARAAVYPETIAVDVSPERLRQWFYRYNGQYRIKKDIRESVLFAAHDILQDTPFSRLDLITCRNLLIYLNRDAQERVFDTFHFALRPEGRLMLGQSEFLDISSPLFSTVDKQHRIFARRPVSRQPPVSQPPVARSLPLARLRPITHLNEEEGATPTVPPATVPTRAASADELHRAVLEMYAPPSVLLNSEHDILHMSNGAGRFLRLSGGAPTANLLRLVHPDLRTHLRTALYAAETEETDQVRICRVTLPPAATPSTIRLRVRRVVADEALRGYSLVLFEEQSGAEALTDRTEQTDPIQVSPAPSPESSLLSLQMEDEITRLHLQLRSMIEQYEASVEELKASNEELQAMNEELRSAAEELETSREELQSVNEELITVNAELKNRMDELGQAYGDLQNLLASTDIGTLFLDRALCVQRYTPAIESLYNVIPTDIGRPFAHLTHRLKTSAPALPEAAEQVLDDLKFHEIEVATTDERHFLARLRPYRTMDDRIDGVVLAFIDITGLKRAEAALRQSEERYRLLVEGAKDYAMFLIDEDRRIVFWNQGAERVLGWTEEEALGQLCDQVYTPEDRAAGVPEAEIALARAMGSTPDQRWHIRKDGSRLWADGMLTRLENSGPSQLYVKILRDATQTRRAEDELQAAHNKLEERVTERTLELAEMNGKQIELFQRLMTTQEEERQRISRELHDETGQDLTALLLGLGALHALSDDPVAVRDVVTRLQETGDTLAKKVHQIAVRMRPTALDDLGLEAALQTLVNEWGTLNRIPAELAVFGSEAGGQRLPTEIETTVYRVVQESLQNVLKHAKGAQSVSVLLRREPRQVSTIIEDNGVGFDPDAVRDARSEPGERPSLGLLGMSERAALVGGQLTIESAPGKGTTIYLRIPLSDGPVS